MGESGLRSNVSNWWRDKGEQLAARFCPPGTWTGTWGPSPGVEHSKDHCRNLKLIRVATLVFKLASSGCLISSLRINSIQHQETGMSPAPTCQLGQGGIRSQERDVAGRAIIRAFLAA